jgi:hypothetical protein
MILTLHTSLVVAHLVGIVLGVGGATAADFLILRRAIFAPIEAGVVQSVSFLSQIVSAGLVLLWVSGTGLFFEIWDKTPAYHTNQKLWAKITIVAVLTINAFIIHGNVLPRLQQQVGRRLFSGLTLREQITFVASSSVSGVSWYVPLVLGPARELSYVVPFATIILAYIWLLNATGFAILCVAIWATRPSLEERDVLHADGDPIIESPPFQHAYPETPFPDDDPWLRRRVAQHAA